MTDDSAVKIMKEIHSKMNVEIPFRMVEQCYETEKKFLFEKDDSKSLSLLRQIVESHVDNESE